MHIHKLRYTVLGVFIFFFIFSFFAVTRGDTQEDTQTQQNTHAKTSTSILFTGDIMLGRVVESLMEHNGSAYPFLGILDILSSTDVTVGNFEGSVPEVHQKTKPYTFRFSVKDEYLKGLKTVGFDILSLANNHAYDFGQLGFFHTQEVCRESQLVCLGHPREVSGLSAHTQTINGHKIGYLFFNAVLSSLPDVKTLEEHVTELKQETDFVIAYLHWGNEYELEHSKEQEQIAHALVDRGVDLVVGHHPHVVQDVEFYKGKLIVYSLGNFIFDQYFSDEVVEGMLLKVTLGNHTITYEFVGITSKETRSQPHRMNPDAEKQLFSRVLHTIKHDSGQVSLYMF